MSEDTIFYIIFIGQIYFLSYHFPQKIYRRMRYVMATYPAVDYPKLYPNSIDYYDKYHRNFKLANNINILVGFTLIIMALYNGYSPTLEGVEMTVFVYAMVQYMPMIVVERSEFKQFKRMRDANTKTTRKADLQPRRLKNFVPPKLFALASFMFFAAIMFDLSVHDYNFSWGHDTVERAIILTLGNVYFLGMVMWQMFTKKRNPHMDYADRVKALKLMTKVATVTSIMMSIFFMTEAASDVFDMEVYSSIIASIYFQLIGIFGLGIMLKKENIDTMNFDVYKADAVTE